MQSNTASNFVKVKKSSQHPNFLTKISFTNLRLPNQAILMPRVYIELIEDKGEDGKKEGIIVLWQRCILFIINFFI